MENELLEGGMHVKKNIGHNIVINAWPIILMVGMRRLERPTPTSRT